MTTSKAVNFADLELHPDLKKSIAELGWVSPTPIQSAVLPLALHGDRDLIAIAETGSGKTGAFAIPILNRLLEDQASVPSAVVVSPTRELAQQTANVFNALLPGCALTLTGGVPITKQATAVFSRPRPRVLVCTPGRLLELIQKIFNGAVLPDIRYFVLDEADKCLDMEQRATGEIVAALNEGGHPRTLLFSATLGDKVVAVRRAGMRDARLVRVGAAAAADGDGPRVNLPDGLVQSFFVTPEDLRTASLAAVLARLIGPPSAVSAEAAAATAAIAAGRGGRGGRGGLSDRKAIVFCNKQATVELVSRVLHFLGYAATGLHGLMDQDRREHQLDSFRRNAGGVLVATGGLVGRGLDLPDVRFVVNYDLPLDPSEYVHRVGRTARAGSSGRAVSLVTPYSVEAFCKVEKYINMKLTKENWLPAEAEGWAERVGAARREAAVDAGAGAARRPSRGPGGQRRRRR